MQDSKLVMLLAPEGEGKTRIINHLLRSPKLRVGVIVSLVRDAKIPLDKAFLFMEPQPPASPEGAKAIAELAFRLRPGDWLIVDDAESYFHPRRTLSLAATQNPFREFLNYRRNIGINVLLAAKNPLDFTVQMRNNTRLFIVHPSREPSILRWEKEAGFPAEEILPHGFFWVGSREGGWSRIDTNALDKWDPPV
jgi:hypothetical protein